jgi:hypothetical protein
MSVCVTWRCDIRDCTADVVVRPDYIYDGGIEDMAVWPPADWLVVEGASLCPKHAIEHRDRQRKES